MLLGKLLTPMVYILENMKSNINQKNGLRTEKVVNGTTTRYAYTDDRLPHYNQAGQTLFGTTPTGKRSGSGMAG